MTRGAVSRMFLSTVMHLRLNAIYAELCVVLQIAVCIACLRIVWSASLLESLMRANWYGPRFRGRSSFPQPYLSDFCSIQSN